MRRKQEALFTASLLAMVIGCTGCTGTETGNGFEQEIRVGAHSSDPATYAVAIAGGGGVVTEAWITIGALTLIEDGNCDENGASDVETPALSAANRASSRQTVSVQMPEADYCRLIVPLGGAGALPAGAPPELDSTHGVVVIGETGSGTSFRIVGGAPIVSVEGQMPFELSADVGDVFLGFDVATWLDGLDIDGGVVNGGIVTIDEANNSGLLAGFEANVAAGIELYTDTNGNGEADAGEPKLAVGLP